MPALEQPLIFHNSRLSQAVCWVSCRASLAAGCGFAYWAVSQADSGRELGAVLVFALVAVFFIYIGALGLRLRPNCPWTLRISTDALKKRLNKLRKSGPISW